MVIESWYEIANLRHLTIIDSAWLPKLDFLTNLLHKKNQRAFLSFLNSTFEGPDNVGAVVEAHGNCTNKTSSVSSNEAL
jgi:hypothetical protein